MNNNQLKLEILKQQKEDLQNKIGKLGEQVKAIETKMERIHYWNSKQKPSTQEEQL